VSPEQAQQIDVAAELGKLSVTLRSLQSTTVARAMPTRDDGVQPIYAQPDGAGIRPQWAGDVSPALYGAAQPKPVAIKDKPILIMRGGHTPSREIIQPDNEK
jgi:hypothetical protein